MNSLIEEVKKEYEVLLHQSYMYVYNSPFELYKNHYLLGLSTLELIEIIEDFTNGDSLEEILIDKLEVFQVDDKWIYCNKYKDI